MDSKQKAKVTKIMTLFSERTALADRTFDSVLEFDIAVLQASATMAATDLSYYKTDVVVTWSDGHQEMLQLDANRATTLSAHFQDHYRYYTGRREKPEYMTAARWTKRKAEVRRFYETHQV